MPLHATGPTATRHAHTRDIRIASGFSRASHNLSAKRAVMNMVVHAYDLFFYLSSWSTISYLWSDQRRYVVGLVCALLATAIAARIAYHADSTRAIRSASVCLSR